MKEEGDKIECSFIELLTLRENLLIRGLRMVSVKPIPKGYEVKTVPIIQTTDPFNENPGFLPD